MLDGLGRLFARVGICLLSFACGEPAEPDSVPGLDCPGDLYAAVDGCYGRHCAACTVPADCEAYEGCIGGTCGACTRDEECEGRCASGFCVPAELPRWKLTMSEEDWDALRADPYTELFVPCGLSVGDIPYDEGCRIRIRGGSSRDFPKKSFRITFPRDTVHPGYSRKINLRAEYNDPSFVRTLLSHEAVRRFTTLPVSRVEPIELEINGQYFGLMVRVERLGADFLLFNGRALTSLYEADPNRELFASGGGSLIPLPEDVVYRMAYQKKVGTPFDYTDLISLIEALAEAYETGDRGVVREHFQLPGLLDYLAVMGLIQNLDHVRKNYYLSPQPEPDGRLAWEMYPWDLDLTFGCTYDEVAQDTICDSFRADADHRPGVFRSGVSPVYPMSGHYNLLIHLVLEDPELSEAFRCRLCAMIHSPFWRERVPALVDALGSALEEAIVADDRDLNETREDWQRALSEVRGFPAARAEHLAAALGCE